MLSIHLKKTSRTAGAQLEGGGRKTFPALKPLVRICAIFENSMFLLDYKNEYLFGELNEKNRYTIFNI